MASRTPGLLSLPRLLVETIVWTFTAVGIALAVVLVGVRPRRKGRTA